MTAEMLTVDHYLKIRVAHRDGASIRSIAKDLGRSRKTVRKALGCPQPRAYARSKPAAAPKLGAFHSRICQILSDDLTAPPKQRHTAMQVYRRLVKEDSYNGGYDQVRRFISASRSTARETFIPLAHEPGQRMECDFGHVQVDFPDGRRQVPVLVACWSWSNCPFLVALPTERTEAVLSGMTSAFAFFGAVPREVWWDNPKTVATLVGTGRQRTINPYYAGLASHYRFDPLFCMPAKGNEKPDAERTVFALQRRFCTPVPQAQDLAAFNAHLIGCCLEERRRVVSGQSQSIGDRFEQEKLQTIAPPPHAFDACVQTPAVADKYQTVAFDNNRYSVPRQAAFAAVTVKGYVDRVEVVHQGQVLARHARVYGRHESVLDPMHYLIALGRRPAALDHSNVFRDWKLPAEFADLRRRLAELHGERTGCRHFIRVLQLMADHPAERIIRAVQACAGISTLTAEFIKEKAQRLAARQQSASSDTPDVRHPQCVDPIHRVQVPPPDLRRFDQLLVRRHGDDGGELPQPGGALARQEGEPSYV